jgi:predicted transcriptional regulator
VFVYSRVDPRWRYKVTFSAAGLPVGFEVMALPTGRPNVAEAMSDLREGLVRHDEDAPAVTARLMRSLPIGEIQQVAQAALVTRTGPWERDVPNRWGAAFAEAPRPGRKGRDERAYAEVAAMYLALVHGGSKAPLVDLAKRLNYSVSRIKNIIHEARRRGLLSKSSRGRRGGELTEKARRLLDDGT